MSLPGREVPESVEPNRDRGRMCRLLQNRASCSSAIARCRMGYSLPRRLGCSEAGRRSRAGRVISGMLCTSPLYRVPVGTSRPGIALPTRQVRTGTPFRGRAGICATRPAIASLGRSRSGIPGRRAEILQDLPPQPIFACQEHHCANGRSDGLSQPPGGRILCAERFRTAVGVARPSLAFRGLQQR